MRIERVPIEQVQLWEQNPRNIKTKDFERLKKQITELGVYKPLIACKENGGYTVLGGNMRLRALQEMGINEVEISVVDAPDEATKIKYALSDNDRAGEYDEQQLAELVYPYIEVIQLEDYKIDVGEPINLKQVIENYGPSDEGEDDVPEIDDSPAITKLGDLFMLGRHRLLCGDATKEGDVARLMGEKRYKLLVTDPPYGVSYASKNEFLNTYDKGNRIQDEIASDHMTQEEMSEFWVRGFSAVRKWAFVGASYYVTGPQGGDLLLLLLALKESGFPLRHMLIWVKNNHVLGRADYNYKHEPIIYGWVEGKHEFFGGHDVSTWEVNKPLKSDLHSTMKPLELFSRAIKNSSQEGYMVADPFLGSGTTLIACEKLNRTCYGMEIEPKYCDVIITRYANFTGTPEEEIRATVEHG